MSNSFPIFINQALTDRLPAMSAAERRRFEQKLEFLAGGIWDGGLVVKKLTGFSHKVIFEGRLSKGDRLLFTLGQYAGETAVYVWALEHHDDVQRASQRISPANAPFLDFSPHEQAAIDELYLDDFPTEWQTQEAVDEKVDSDYGPQKWHVLEGADWERLGSAQDLDELQYQLLLSSQQYSVLERSPPLLLAGTAGSGKTTLAVYYMLRKEFLGKPRLFTTYSPYLRDFARRLYAGLIQGGPLADRPPHPDFMTLAELQRSFLPEQSPCSNPAKEVGFREFQTILSGYGPARKYDAELVWEEIRSIIKGASPYIPIRRLQDLATSLREDRLSRRERQELAAEIATLGRFAAFQKAGRQLYKRTGFDDLEAFANAFGASGTMGFNSSGGVGTIGGMSTTSSMSGTGGMSTTARKSSSGTAASSGDNVTLSRAEELAAIDIILDAARHKPEAFSRPLLTLDEYLNLGLKRAPNFMYDRAEIHGIAEYYQRKLDEAGLFDTIDIARRAIMERRRPVADNVSRPQWDLVVCDEIQDLADIQVELLFDAAADRNHVFFAGDERQIINPSGFRWEEIRQRFHEAGARVPDIISLGLNFRSTGSIVGLANALLALKKDLLGAKKHERPEEWKFAGKPPVVIKGLPEKRILAILRNRGADRIILTRNQAERDRLRTALATELVFTIHEAKGLEFEAVMLWKFVDDADAAGLWRRLADGLDIPDDRSAHVRYEINLLYVAVTRARALLSIYDGKEPAPVWRTKAIEDAVVKADDEAFLLESWSRASSPAEWARQADYFQQRQYYRAAAECWDNAGDATRANTARAMADRQDGNYRAAAAAFESAGMYLDAAQCHELLHDYARAAELYGQSGDSAARARLRILILEQQKQYAEAGHLRLKNGEIDLAIKDWELGGEFALIAAHLEKHGRPAEAADWYARAKAWLSAARLYKKAGNRSREAEMHYQAGNADKALSIIRKHGSAEAYQDFCKRSGDLRLMGYISLEANRRDDAIRQFRQFASQSAENRTLLEADAAAAPVKRPNLKTALLNYSLGRYAEAALAFNYIFDLKMSADAHGKAGQHDQAALTFEKIKLYDRAIAEWDQHEPADHPQRCSLIIHLHSCVYNQIHLTTSKKGYNQTLANKAYELGAKLVDSKRYIHALPRLLLFSDLPLVQDALHGLANDDLAVWLAFNWNKPTIWLDYRHARGRMRIDPENLFRMIREDSFYRSLDEDRAAGIAMRAMLLYFKDAIASAPAGQLSAVSAAIRRRTVEHSTFLYQADASGFMAVADDLIDLLLRLQGYNSISKLLDLLSTDSSSRNSAELVRIIKSIEQLAESGNDDNLRLCLAAHTDGNNYRALLKTVGINDWNWRILAKDRGRWREVCDFLVNESRIEEAVILCKQNKDLLRAADIFEATGQYREAARTLEKIGALNRAMALYRQHGDQRSIASLSKRMGVVADIPASAQQAGKSVTATATTPSDDAEPGRQPVQQEFDL